MDKVRVIISSQIQIIGLPEAMKGPIKEALSLPNPAYYKAIRANPRLQYNPNFSPVIKYYEETKGGRLILPRGCADRVIEFLKKVNFVVEIREGNEAVAAIIGRSSIVLRDYQAGIAEHIAAYATHGIVRLDTGFGKTIIALKLIELLQQKALIVVPRIDIFNQFCDEIRKYFGEEPGIIRGKKLCIGDITVATGKSLSKGLDRINHEEFGVILFDECHGSISPGGLQILRHFRPSRLYGFTGTLGRSDGQGEAIKFYFGEVIIDRKLPRKSPNVYIVENTTPIPVTEYAEMIGYQTGDWIRNNLIVSVIQERIAQGRKVLVLTKRVKHYELINQRLGDGSLVKGISSLATDAKRKELMSGLRDGSIDYQCLLGTFSLLSTGVDIPSLDCLIIAGDLRSEVLLEQSGGRILRLLEGKNDPVIVDIWDTKNKILRYQGLERQKAYRKLGWGICKKI